MKLSEVQSIAPTGRTWQSQKGLIYYFTIGLSDGTTGEAGAVRAEGPPYKVGDKVEYEITKDDPKYGKKLKIKKADGGFTKAKGGSNYDPLPGFCCDNIAFCISEVRKDNGEENFTIDQLVDKMYNLHKMHEKLTNLVRERIKAPTKVNNKQPAETSLEIHHNEDDVTIRGHTIKTVCSWLLPHLWLRSRQD